MNKKKMLISILLLVLSIAFSYPCSCIEPPPPEEAYADADVVFSGEVINIVIDESDNYFEVTFQIIDIWKGEDLEEITILTELYSDTCGYNFQIHQEYLVYAYNYNWGMYTNICTRTNLLEYASEDLHFLNGINSCETGFSEINGLCFNEGDISILQKLIDNSYNSGIDLNCDDSSIYCGSPNPQMDSPTDSWFWNIIDGQQHFFADGDGVVEPLELGLQEWNDGRLTSIMCGAYIYCQLSGSIPNEIHELTEIEQLRLEYNYLSGFIPENICELDTDHFDYLAFDVGGNRLCPPYPECIDTSGFWSQDTSSCSEIGDINYDDIINVLDVILLVSFILEDNNLSYQEFIISDLNSDGSINILDVVEIVNIIL